MAAEAAQGLPQPGGGRKEYKDDQDNVTKVVEWFGYKLHLLVDVKRGTVIAPVGAIQRGPRGTFVYLVKADHTVEVRPVTVGPTGRTEASIESGLSADDVVVVEGTDKLREGVVVQAREPARDAAGPKPAA